MRTKRLRPFLEAHRPLFLVLFKYVFAVEVEFKLVIAVKLIAKHAHEVNIKFVQEGEVATLVVPDPDSHVVHHAKRVATQQVLDPDKIHEVLKERCFER